MKRSKNTMRIGANFFLGIAIFICTILLSVSKVSASSNITIAGVDLGYSDGSYFSKTGSACKCHGRGTCGEAADCTCIVISGASQCYGWSMWVENKLFGSNERSNPSDFTTVLSGYSNCTGSELYNKLNGKIGAGTHIRTSSSQKGYAHSISVISYDSNGINITDCNHSGRCQVDVRYYTWDSFASFMNGYGGISFVKTNKNGVSAPSNPAGNTYYNSYGFDNPSKNEVITEGTFLFQGWIDAKKEIASITCSVNHGAHYTETALYKRPDVPNATAFRAEVDSNLLNLGTNDVALCVNFKDGSATVVENRTVTWTPRLQWGFDSPTEGKQISDNQFQFSGWIESGRKLERIACSINHGERYLTAALYKRPDVPNATAFRLDIDSSYLHYGENYIAICAYYADGAGQTIAEHKVNKCIADAIEYPQNEERVTCKNASFLLQGWSIDDNKKIDHFEFTVNGVRYSTAAHSRADLLANARYYREEVPLTKLQDGNNKIEIFAIYTDGTSRNIGQVGVLGEINHKWDSGKITQVATCAKSGIKTYTCAECKNIKTEEIPATGKHINTEVRNAKIATCTVEGYTGDTYCKDCGTLISTGQKISKKEHSWYKIVIVKQPTCTEPGIKDHICAECLGRKSEEIPPTGIHTNTEIRNAKEATCAEDGYTGDTYCKDCGTQISTGQIIEKTAHTWDEGTVTKKATCTETGIRTYTCEICQATKTEIISATGKHENTEVRNVKDPTCSQEGYTGDTYCQDCGALLEEGKIIPKTEHIWNVGEVTKTASCTAEGVKTFTCTSCGITKTEAIAAIGHGSTEIRNEKTASCASEGYTGDSYCTVCGQKISSGSVIAKTAHSWDDGVVTKQPTAAEEGIKTYTCRNCGATQTETLAKLEPQTATPGKTIKDKATNGIYKVLNDGLSVEFTKSISKKASIKIPDTITVNGITCKVTGISSNAFKNNASLKSVTIGANVTAIGTNAFYGCKKLNKVSGGAGIVKIGDKAFANCGSLSSITISATVRSIGKQAFYNCKKLRTIIVKTSALSSKNIGSKAFAGTYQKPTVKVPAKQMKAYKKLLKSRGMNSNAVYKK